MSGSSHGTCGAPERDWYTRSYGRDRPSAAATPCATSAATASCWATYAPWGGRAPGGPLDSAMATGTECVVKASRAPARTGSGSSASAASVEAMNGSTNPGWSK